MPISAILSAHAKLARRLDKFAFAELAVLAGGLLTRIENHPATIRLEALAHLAAACAKGSVIPNSAQVRDFLNGALATGWIHSSQDPVEDVFVSNVAAWSGNARIFEGIWQSNGFYLQQALRALIVAGERPWIPPLHRPISSLLALSEEAAARAGAARYSLSAALPMTPLMLGPAVLQQAKVVVTFDGETLKRLGVDKTALSPFLFRPGVDDVKGEEIGHSALERRPLIEHGDGVILALPTAVSPAIRRFILEVADSAGELSLYDDALKEVDRAEVALGARTGWAIETVEAGNDIAALNVHQFVGRFDRGAYAHIIVLHEPCADLLANGLLNLHSLSPAFTAHVHAEAARIAGFPDYKRGLTLVVRGGLGGSQMAGFNAFPPNWQLAFMGVDDFAQFGWDADFDCTHAWKVLDREDQMRAAGVSMFNFDGFVNLYAAALSTDFALWPEEIDKGWINFGSDFQAPMRHKRRTALDSHAVMAPSGQHWIAVQRRNLDPFFKEAINEPIYVSPAHVSSGELLGCVETPDRIWWVRCGEHPATPFESGLITRLWDMTLNWMQRVARALESHGVVLPPAVRVDLRFPSGVFKATEDANEGADAPLTFAINGATLEISCPQTYVNAFRRATNDGDRRMVETLLAGFVAMAGLKDGPFVAAATEAIAGDPLARWFHSFEADTPLTIVSTASDPGFRMVHALDRQRARLGLAREAGRDKPGPVPLQDANALMQKAVEILWSRLRRKLQAYDRADTIERCVANLSAIEIDRVSWRRTAAALLAISSDPADVVAAGSAREVDRTVAALAYRTIVEMAICTCPIASGAAISDIELDDLLGDVTALLDCASESDALHYGFVATQPMVHRNGTFVVRSEMMEEVFRPFRDAHGARQFATHAGSYKSHFKDPDAKQGTGPDPRFTAAFEAEFGVSPTDLMDFNFRIAHLAQKAGAPSLRLKQSELAALLQQSAPKGDTAKAIAALSLAPRKRWDEKSPTNAKARDWWPWRFSRRLSVTRRPLLRMDDGDDPVFVVSPALLDLTMLYLLRAHEGDLPDTLFDTGLKTWIGHATNLAGHAFNDAVAEKLKAQGCKVDPEVAMTALGGEAVHGDVDVLAWRPGSPIVYIVECKRLMMSRSVGEIGERLQEYSGSSKAGDPRTPGEKHRDRITQLKAAPAALAKRIGVAPEALEIRSALIFDGLVPMQFSRACLGRFNVVTDVDSLALLSFD